MSLGRWLCFVLATVDHTFKCMEFLIPYRNTNARTLCVLPVFQYRVQRTHFRNTKHTSTLHVACCDMKFLPWFLILITSSHPHPRTSLMGYLVFTTSRFTSAPRVPLPLLHLYTCACCLRQKLSHLLVW